MEQNILEEIANLTKRYNDKLQEYEQVSSDHKNNIRKYGEICNAQNLKNAQMNVRDVKLQVKKQFALAYLQICTHMKIIMNRYYLHEVSLIM